jgi:hypothetical protein
MLWRRASDVQIGDHMQISAVQPVSSTKESLYKKLFDVME